MDSDDLTDGQGPTFGTLAMPSGPHPATTVTPRGGSRGRVVVLPGIHGSTPHILGVCRRLAGAGIGSVVVDSSCEAARGDGLRSPADVAAAVADLDDAAIAAEVAQLAESLAEREPVAVLGYCIGGTLGLLATARTGALSATVAYYGVLRHRGPLAGKGPDPLDSVGDTSTPVLAHYGTRDAWCEGADVDDLEAKLLASGGDHTVYRYPGAGHAFEEPGSAGFRAVAAAEAAARTSVFLDHYLGA
jgi:carboxymethylenebutenolidase